MLPYFLSFLSGYLVGSFPTGYLLVKQQANIDISKAGSGNVGAYNAGVVTGSKWTGIAVGVTDGVKGALAVLIAGLWSAGYAGHAVALLAAVVGHNYPVWLRFKGGRGLATACGGFFLLANSYVIVWCTIWAVLKWQKQTILTSNLLAILATPVVLLILPGRLLEALMIVPGDAENVRWLSVALSTILVLSHIDAWKELKRSKGG